MNNLDYRIENIDNRKTLVCFSEWTDSLTEIAKNEKVTGITYVPISVKKQINLGFLSSFPDLHGFGIKVSSSDPIANFDFLYNLKRLEFLNCNTYWDSKIEFSKFKHLREIIFYWHFNESFFKCSNIRVIQIEQYPKEDLEEFSAFKNLEVLTLYSPKLKSLRGLPISIRCLNLILANSLLDIQDISTLIHLEELEIDGGCKKIVDISSIGRISTLKELTLNDLGEINSFLPLSNLKQLTKLHFTGSTKVKDGNLFELSKMPHLVDVTFQNRQHYSHRREFFQKEKREE